MSESDLRWLQRLRENRIERMLGSDGQPRATTPPAPPAAPVERVKWKDPFHDKDVALVINDEDVVVDVRDRRGTKSFRSPVLKQLPPNARLLAQGRAGALFTGGWHPASNEYLGENVVVGAPLVCEMLQPGDGPGEVMLATTAVTSYMLANRVAGRINAEAVGACARSGWETARAMQHVHSGITRSMVRALAALEQIRALRRDWDHMFVPRAKGEMAASNEVEVQDVSH